MGKQNNPVGGKKDSNVDEALLNNSKYICVSETQLPDDTRTQTENSVG